MQLSAVHRVVPVASAISRWMWLKQQREQKRRRATSVIMLMMVFCVLVCKVDFEWRICGVLSMQMQMDLSRSSKPPTLTAKNVPQKAKTDYSPPSRRARTYSNLDMHRPIADAPNRRSHPRSNRKKQVASQCNHYRAHKARSVLLHTERM